MFEPRESTERGVLLFVYGTLRSEAGHPMHALLARGATPLGAGRVAGRLYDLGGYPGVVLTARAESAAAESAAAESGAARAGWVLGELYRLERPEILARLDAYEGCGPDDPLPHLFRRVRADVVLRTGTVVAAARSVRAWLYHYEGPLGSARPISSGDYLAR